ncbi:hypothetical protein V6N13_102078 [Hibiscus sabdariffa]|uniref:Uncharacterized protein n=1 Tax=Hibiscus sabdariffa TaxID=183260 RepID=A0ABR2D301_9ROSI
MHRFLYELCWTMVRGELPFQKCKAVLDAVEFAERVSQDELVACFADMISSRKWLKTQVACKHKCLVYSTPRVMGHRD